MSAYNDYMLKVITGFVELADHYSTKTQLGIDDCCLRNKLNILAMYIDTIPNLCADSSANLERVLAISMHMNDLIGYPNWEVTDCTGSTFITGTDGTPIIVDGGTGSSDSSAWNTTIGLAPTSILFSKSLGTNGNSWGMSFIIYNSAGEEVGYTISARTKDGFVITATEDNVHFEGSATKIT